MFAKLTALVGSGSALPFDLQEQDPYPSAWGQWTHFKGVLRADGSNVSVFRISSPNKHDQKMEAARNGVKKLRTLRHPNILSFKDTAEVEERGETVIYLATEAVTPLAYTLSSIGLNGPQREEYLSMGMHQIVSAVSFLNNDCKFVHGNICAAAVVVTEQLDWKLHGFDLTTEHQWNPSMGQQSIPLAAASWMVAAQYKPGEIAKGEWEVVRESPAWSVDAWGLGCLIQEVYSGSPLARTEDLRVTDSIPKALLQFYQKLLASQPARRLNPAKIVEAGVLRNKLAETTAFLENLALKDVMEKDAFFKRLPSLLPSIPESVAQRKLLPLLASALEFGGAPPVALGTLLRIGEGMPEEERSKQVIPILTKLFNSNDRGIRRGLLENIASFGPSLPPALIEEQIYPSVQGGFGDANPYIRELTLKSMVVLGPKLSQKTLNQSLLKHLAKLQVDEEPAIRANTTVLLGNLAPFLSEGTCKKVLLNAFTRAMRDPFPPARVAGLKAILATAKFHGPDDAAARVIPMVGPLCVDPVGEVRLSALQCMEHFIEQLQTNSKEMEKRAVDSGSNGDVSASGGMGSAAAGGVASAGGSLLTGFGWAVSSLYKGAGAVEGPPPPSSSYQQQQQPQRPHSQSSMQAFGSGSAPQPHPGNAPPSRTLQQTTTTAAAAAATNGWDDDEDMDILPRGNAPGGSGSGSAAVTRQQPAMTSTSGGGGGGWDEGNDDDEPFEDMLDFMSAEMEARKKLSSVSVSRPAASVRAKPAVGVAARKPVGGGGAAAGGKAVVGGGMKLGASKLGAKKMDVEEEDEFADW